MRQRQQGWEGRHADEEGGHDTDLGTAGPRGPRADRQGGRLRSEREARVENMEAASMPWAHRERRLQVPMGSST